MRSNRSRTRRYLQQLVLRFPYVVIEDSQVVFRTDDFRAALGFLAGRERAVLSQVLCPAGDLAEEATRVLKNG